MNINKNNKIKRDRISDRSTFVNNCREFFNAIKTIVPDGGDALINACTKGDVNVVKKLLKDGADINLKNVEFASKPLLVAIGFGNLEVVKILVKHGANIHDGEGEELVTPIMLACMMGCIDIVKFLSEKGADLKTREINDFTLLHVAAEGGYLDLAKFLIGKGLDVNAISQCKSRPIHHACLFGRFNVVQLLVENGSDFQGGSSITKTSDGLSEEGTTPLQLATAVGNVEIVKYLIHIGAKVNATQTSYKLTALHLACEVGSLEICNILIKAGASVNMKNVDDATPLHSAIYFNNPDIVVRLLECNADIESRTSVGETALHLAACQGLVDVIKILLDKNADINAVTENGITPLNLAVKQEHLECAQYLIERGANIHIRDDFNWIALHTASYFGFSLDLVEKLISKGSDVNAKTNKGKTPLHFASKFSHLVILKSLLRNNADVNIKNYKLWTPLHYACRSSSFICVEELLNAKADINALTSQLLTPLHIAASFGLTEITELLLEKGAKVNIKDKQGCTPLICAVMHVNIDIIKLLLNYKADIDINENTGKRSALHYAALSKDESIIELLAKNGGNVNIVMIAGGHHVTPLHAASAVGNLKAIQSLLQFGALYNTKDKYSPLYFATRNKQNEVVQYFHLLDNMFRALKSDNCKKLEEHLIEGAVANSKSSTLNYPIIYAAWKGYIQVLKILLKYKANVNLKGDNDCTALHYAAKYNHYHIVQCLLQNGAIYNSFTIKESKSPCDFAVKDSPVYKLLQFIDKCFDEVGKGNVQIIDELKEINCNMPGGINCILNARNNLGKSLVQVALINKRNQLAGILISLI